MATHPMGIDWPSVEAMIVQTADAVSAAHPGTVIRETRAIDHAR